MGRLCVSHSQENRFAVYCGGGVYVHAVEHFPNQSIIQTGPVAGALAASRRVAIGALHSARRAGLGAWLVQHPGGGVVSSVGVAA